MTTTAPEPGAQQTGQQPPAGGQAPPAQTPPPAGQQPPPAGQTPPPAGQQPPAAGQGDELTPEEEAALGDPGKRAVTRIKGERNAAREQVTTLTAERDGLATQLQAALAQIAAGGDQTQQQALQTVTTERDNAQTSLRQLQAAVRNQLPNPLQMAAFLQGADDAALDASAGVLKSLGGAPAGGQATPPPPPIPNGDQHAAPPGGGQAGELSMSDRIRAAAGRRVS